MAWDDNLSGAFVSRNLFIVHYTIYVMKNNRLLTALRYVGDPSRDGAAQYLIATASAQEVTQAYDVFVTTLEESYDGQPIHRFLSELCHARVELQSLQQTDFFKVKKK